jgi:HSP20 family molecular chaperone IbpA
MTTNNHSSEYPYKNNPLYTLFEMFYGPEVAMRLFEEEMGIAHAQCNCKTDGECECEKHNHNTEKVKAGYNEIKREFDKVKENNRNNKPLNPEARVYACRSTFTYGATNVLVGDDGHCHITMLLPGFKKENIEVSYKGKTLVIVASSMKRVADCDSTEVCAHKTVKEEYRSAETVKREFTLNNPVFEEAKLDFTDGVLSIMVPAKKPEEAKKLSF